MTQVFRLAGLNTLIIGDFNAYHHSWTTRPEPKGKKLVRLAHQSHFHILGPDTPTFRSRSNGTISTSIYFLPNLAHMLPYPLALSLPQAIMIQLSSILSHHPNPYHKPLAESLKVCSRALEIRNILQTIINHIFRRSLISSTKQTPRKLLNGFTGGRSYYLCTMRIDL